MFRIGLGHDTHRLTEGSFIMLGGVRIDHDRALLGHSDSDALLHAVTDALLGAAGLGDIGDLFPDTDPANKGRDSAEMLSNVWKQVQGRGWSIVNLDAVIFAEKPKLSPFKDRIKVRIAQILGIATDRIGIKAKTGEQVGPIGRKEAISAECVVLLQRSKSEMEDGA